MRIITETFNALGASRVHNYVGNGTIGWTSSLET